MEHHQHQHKTIEVQCSSNPLASSAAALMQVAAYRIDLPADVLNSILDRLSQECIHEEWQLKFLDSFNWQSMGAPIGLVAAVRSYLQEKQQVGGEGSITCTTCSCGSLSLDRYASEESVGYPTAVLPLSQQPPPHPPPPANPTMSTSQAIAQSMIKKLLVPPLTTAPAGLGLGLGLGLAAARRTAMASTKDDSQRSFATPNTAPAIPTRRATVLQSDQLQQQLNQINLDEEDQASQQHQQAHMNFSMLSSPRLPERQKTIDLTDLLLQRNDGISHPL